MAKEDREETGTPVIDQEPDPSSPETGKEATLDGEAGVSDQGRTTPPNGEDHDPHTIMGHMSREEVRLVQTRVARWFFVLFSLAVVAAFVMLIRPFIEVIFIAFSLFIIGRPMYEFFKRITKGRRVVASIVTCALLVLVIFLPLLGFMGLLANHAHGFYEDLQQEFASGRLQGFLDPRTSPLWTRAVEVVPQLGQIDLKGAEVASKALGAASEFLYSHATAALKGITGVLLGFVLVMFVTFYMFLDGDDLLEEFKRLSPFDDRYDQEIIDEFTKTIRVTFKGSLVIGLVQGTLGAVGFAICGVRSWAMWGLVMGIASFIPLVGTGIIWVPAALYLLVTGHYWQAGVLTAWGALVIGLSDNLVRTWVVQEETKIHPLLVFFSVIGGLSVFGFLGIILGPLVLSLLIYVLRLYKRFVTTGSTATAS